MADDMVETIDLTGNALAEKVDLTAEGTQPQQQPSLRNTRYQPLGFQQALPAGPRPPNPAGLSAPPWASTSTPGSYCLSSDGLSSDGSGWGRGGSSRSGWGSGASSSGGGNYRQTSPQGFQGGSPAPGRGGGYARGAAAGGPGRGNSLGYRTKIPGGYHGWGGSGPRGPRFDSPGGRGSRPGSASGPLPWVKQGCWLVPRPGSSDAAAISSAAMAAAVRPPGPASSSGAASSCCGSSGERVVVIMRGLPGSGKSTRAAQIAAEARQAAAAAAAATTVVAAVAAAGAAAEACCAAAAEAVVVALPGAADAMPSPSALSAAAAESSSSSSIVAIHSTDSFFINAAGIYQFDPELLGVNHQRNQEAFAASLAAGVQTVIVDNTNIQPWQFEHYVRAAWGAGYRVREETVGEFSPAAAALYAGRNVHGVPHDKILIMLDQWQRQ